MSFMLISLASVKPKQAGDGRWTPRYRERLGGETNVNERDESFTIGGDPHRRETDGGVPTCIPRTLILRQLF